MATHQTPKRAWDSRARGSRLGNLIFLRLIQWGGLIPAYTLLTFVALRYTLRDKASLAALRQLHKRLETNCSPAILYRHFFAFGMQLIDGTAFLLRKRSPFFITNTGEHHIRAALQDRRGAILVTAHIGNWEIAGNLLHDNLDVPIHVIMLDQEREEIRNVFSQATARRRVSIIPVGDPVRVMIEVKKTLAANGIVCVVGDRISGNEASIELPFLGAPTRFPTGPFVFGALTGAPLLAVFSLKTGPRHYENRMFHRIEITDVTRDNRDQKIESAMREYVGILEKIVRAYPFQWFNFFPYWKE